MILHLPRSRMREDGDRRGPATVYAMPLSEAAMKRLSFADYNALCQMQVARNLARYRQSKQAQTAELFRTFGLDTVADML